MVIEGFTGTHALETYRMSDFDSLPESPGLYSWHIFGDSSRGEEYHAFHKVKRLSVVVSGQLQENYSGPITADKYDDIPSDTDYDSELLKLASAGFSPPIYIGRSKNLRTRLMGHKSKFDNVEVPSFEELEEMELPDDEIDEEGESNFFAKRLACLIDTSDLYENSFVVKVVYNSNYENLEDYYSKVKSTENLLNRTFHPLLGRN